MKNSSLEELKNEISLTKDVIESGEEELEDIETIGFVNGLKWVLSKIKYIERAKKLRK